MAATLPPRTPAAKPVANAPDAVGMRGSGSMVADDVFVLDRVRIEVALEARARYKYVQPRVLREGLGWKIVSPNCSRNVDPNGGEIEIAWLVPVQPGVAGQGSDAGGWLLHARDHRNGCWLRKMGPAPLADVLDRLVDDDHREFWQ